MGGSFYILIVVMMAMIRGAFIGFDGNYFLFLCKDQDLRKMDVFYEWTLLIIKWMIGIVGILGVCIFVIFKHSTFYKFGFDENEIIKDKIQCFQQYNQRNVTMHRFYDQSLYDKK